MAHLDTQTSTSSVAQCFLDTIFINSNVAHFLPLAFLIPIFSILEYKYFHHSLHVATSITVVANRNV